MSEQMPFDETWKNGRPTRWQVGDHVAWRDDKHHQHLAEVIGVHEAGLTLRRTSSIKASRPITLLYSSAEFASMTAAPPLPGWLAVNVNRRDGARMVLGHMTTLTSSIPNLVSRLAGRPALLVIDDHAQPYGGSRDQPGLSDRPDGSVLGTVAVMHQLDGAAGTWLYQLGKPLIEPREVKPEQFDLNKLIRPCDWLAAHASSPAAVTGRPFDLRLAR